MKRAVGLLAALACAGCYRATYSHLTPPASELGSGVALQEPRKDPSYGWHHFFFWGVDPPEELVDAKEICGGTQYIVRIETQQSAVQGFIEAIAGYYVNIYAPFNGEVFCKGRPADAAASATPVPATAQPAAATVPAGTATKP